MLAFIDCAPKDYLSCLTALVSTEIDVLRSVITNPGFRGMADVWAVRRPRPTFVKIFICGFERFYKHNRVSTVYV
jgi:hypothetical protein